MNEEKTLIRRTDAPEAVRLLNSLDTRAVVMGCACVVLSSLKLEELLWVKSHHPEILSLIGENGQP